jgi:hypothetical protein
MDYKVCRQKRSKHINCDTDYDISDNICKQFSVFKFEQDIDYLDLCLMKKKIKYISVVAYIIFTG